jgi:cellulose biosynthesis protein BcsQ
LTLSRRAYEEVRTFLAEDEPGGPLLFPVFTMVDRRRLTHRAALEADAGWPVIPMASAIEAMADRHAPVGEYAPRTAAAEAFRHLWRRIEPELPES